MVFMAPWSIHVYANGLCKMQVYARVRNMSLCPLTLHTTVTTASVTVPRRSHVTKRFCVIHRRLAKLLLNFAILVAVAHPILQVSVQFAARNTTLTTIHLTLDAQLVKAATVTSLKIGSARGCIAVSTAPGPFQVVGARVPTRQRHGLWVLALMDGIEARVGQAQARSVDGVKEVEEVVVDFGREVDNVGVVAGLGLAGVHGFGLFIRDGLRAARRGFLADSQWFLRDLDLGFLGDWGGRAEYAVLRDSGVDINGARSRLRRRRRRVVCEFGWRFGKGVSATRLLHHVALLVQLFDAADVFVSRRLLCHGCWGLWESGRRSHGVEVVRGGSRVCEELNHDGGLCWC